MLHAGLLEGNPNQITITVKNTHIFQSYGFLVAIIDWKDNVILNEKYYNKNSIVHSKYLTSFIGGTVQAIHDDVKNNIISVISHENFEKYISDLLTH